MPERFTRVVPQPEETVPDQAHTEAQTPGPAGETFQPPEPEPVGPQPEPEVKGHKVPQPQAQQKMPETIQVPMAQFIQMQQQLAHATQLKPIPEDATTLKLAEKCATISQGGHELAAFVIHQTQQTPTGFVPIEQTLVLCKKCGASLAQIRGSLGL